MKNINLLQYAVKYLSKYNSSKRNLKRILKSKIQKSTTIKKERYELYNEIDNVIHKLEKNKLIDDQKFTQSKINMFSKQGKSKIYIKDYLCKKGIEKNIAEEELKLFDDQNYNWEKESALNYAIKKNLLKDNENIEKKLGKMARAGFSYEICKEILKIS